MSMGAIYCFSNQSSIGILKITTQKVNHLNWVLELSKKVINSIEKLQSIYKLLEERKDVGIGFFRISIDDITHILQVIPGEMIIYGDIDEDSQTRKNAFTNGQRIKHTTCKSFNKPKHEWVGIFDNSSIKCNERVFKSLNQFAECHYIEERPDRVQVSMLGTNAIMKSMEIGYLHAIFQVKS